MMFLTDLQASLSNIHRSLKPGGHFAAVVWASPEQDTLVATATNTCNERKCFNFIS
jgi:SAM-dependent methyltransferase